MRIYQCTLPPLLLRLVLTKLLVQGFAVRNETQLVFCLTQCRRIGLPLCLKWRRHSLLAYRQLAQFSSDLLNFLNYLFFVHIRRIVGGGVVGHIPIDHPLDLLQEAVEALKDLNRRQRLPDDLLQIVKFLDLASYIAQTFGRYCILDGLET